MQASSTASTTVTGAQAPEAPAAQDEATIATLRAELEAERAETARLRRVAIGTHYPEVYW